jgi:chemotaxis protein CheX
VTQPRKENLSRPDAKTRPFFPIILVVVCSGWAKGIVKPRVRISWQWRCRRIRKKGQDIRPVGGLCPSKYLDGEAQLDNVLKLPATMDAARARAVFEDLSTRRGTPLIVDASEVEKASALAIEVLIAGERQWRSDGLRFELANIPDPVMDTCAGLGLHDVFGTHAPDARTAPGGAA